MIDSLTLGLKEGTGISAYARGTLGFLEASGHQTHVLYGAGSVAWHRLWPHSPSPLAFFQRVALGMPSLYPGGRLKRLWTLARAVGIDLLAHRLGLYPGLQTMARPATMDWREYGRLLPPAAVAWNSAMLFERAQAYFRLTGRVFRFKAPEDVDVYHSTLPFPLMASNKPNVCTFHDIIPLVLPGVTHVDLPEHRRMCAAVLEGFDLAVADSDHTRRDLLAEFGVLPGKVVVAHVPTDIAATAGTLAPHEMKACLARHKLAAGGYLLALGSLEPRKNLVRLVRAYSEAGTSLPLVIVGKDGWMFEDIHRAIKPMVKSAGTAAETEARGKQVIRFDYLPPEDVAVLLQHARALVFPSLYEGFGLPVLEAMALGCPVIASNTSSIPEIAGDAALLVDPYSVAGISRAIDQLCEDDGLCRQLAARGLVQSSRFTAQVCRDQLLAAYRQAGAMN